MKLFEGKWAQLGSIYVKRNKPNVELQTPHVFNNMCIYTYGYMFVCVSIMNIERRT